MSEFTVRDKHLCATREAGMRRRVYPRWIETGKMKPQQAAREIALMEEIALEYLLQAESERLI